MNSRILPILMIFIAIGVFFGYINPEWNGAIATTQAAIASDNTALAAAEQYVSQEKQLADARDAIDPANLTALTTLLPDSVDNVGLILDLNALAARTGLSISNADVVTGSTDTSSSGASNPVGSVDLTLSAAGTFSALQSFLSGIEQSARLLDVQDLSIKGSDTGVYTYQMRIRIYWLH